MDSGITIRLAVDTDFESICQIWWDRVENSFNSSHYDEVECKRKFRENFQNRDGIFNFWVAVDSENTVLGWQSLIKALTHPFKENAFAESSTYIAKSNRFKNLGKLLLDHALTEAEKSELEYVIGFLANNNTAAKKITKETGWVEIGMLPSSKKENGEPPKLFLVRPV